MDFIRSWLSSVVGIVNDSAPALVVGFFLAGLVRAFIPQGWIDRHLVTRGPGAVLKAAALGVPLPLCSCSVIPAAAALRSRGVSKGASAAFAISTPEVDAPSMALSWSLLGPPIAIGRPVAAFVSAVLAGTLIDRLCASDGLSRGPSKVKPCCAAKAPPDTMPAQASPTVASPGAGPPCCPVLAPPGPSWWSKSIESVRHGLITTPADLSSWLMVGLVLSALIGVLLPPRLLEPLAGTPWAYVGALLLGLPIYVCATASTPLAVILIAKGLSPGAALVFLLAGPATNFATMAWVLKDLGRKALVLYLGAIAIVAVAAGVVIDAVIPSSWSAVAAGAVASAHVHGVTTGLSWWGGAATALLGLGLFNRYRPRLARPPTDAAPKQFAESGRCARGRPVTPPAAP